MLQIPRKLVSRGIAIGRLALERPVQHFLEGRRDLRIHLARRDRIIQHPVIHNRNASAYIIAFDNTNGTATGIALDAVSAGQVNIPVTVRGDTGAQIATDTITLAANGHDAFTLGVCGRARQARHQ